MSYGIVRSPIVTSLCQGEAQRGLFDRSGRFPRTAGGAGRQPSNAFQGPVALPSAGRASHDMTQVMSSCRTRLTIFRTIVKRESIDLGES